ncbi:hypothetical protein [Mesorhizobium sp. M0037]|uniref:hypothetical protein n=1 Tax=unclassified Mesorhizobium TaxID=325217 RepID=UPI00333C8379
MNTMAPADELHRLAKRALDNGTATSIAESERLLHGYRIALTIGANEAKDRNHQTALLTAVALGRRVFLGGVFVDGPLDTPLLSPLLFGRTLAEAIATLGGTCGPAPSAHVPHIVIGGPVRARIDRFEVRAVFDGWRGGIVPGHKPGLGAGEIPTMPLSAMLAAALAVNEAFLHFSGEMAAAGRRSVGLNLWDIERSVDWFENDSAAPALRYLPTRLWLVGLGHLGQAYLWGLGLLPFSADVKVQLVLQDNDKITGSTESTSVLSDRTMIGLKKTRAMAAWADRRGFETTITERLFDQQFRRRHDEPAIALCGMDNAQGRRALDQVGFDFVVEAGLGRSHQDFRSMLVHTLPGELTASELWKEAESATPQALEAAAYRSMLADGSLDQCGVTLLAGKAVGAPFVGAVAATLVLCEVLRLLHGGPLHRLIDLNLIDPTRLRAAQQTRDFSTFNPGFSEVHGRQ